jgi:hypothetical protein
MTRLARVPERNGRERSLVIFQGRFLPMGVSIVFNELLIKLLHL